MAFLEKIKPIPPYTGELPLTLVGKPSVIIPSVMKALDNYFKTCPLDDLSASLWITLSNLLNMAYSREQESKRIILGLSRMVCANDISNDAFILAEKEGLLRMRPDKLYEPVYTIEMSNLGKLVNIWKKKIDEYRSTHPDSILSLPTAKEMSARIWTEKTENNVSANSLRKYIANTAPCHQDDLAS